MLSFEKRSGYLLGLLLRRRILWPRSQLTGHHGRLLSGILFVATALTAFSHICQAAAGWTDFGQVSNLNQQPASGAAPGIVLINVSTTANPSGCTVANGYYLSVTDDRTTRVFTMLMMAQATGRTVQLWVTGTCNVWGYALLDGVVVQ